MAFSNIIVEKKDKVAWITLNRPQALNALSRETMNEIREAFEDIGQDDSVRVAVIRGAGRCFGAGADLKQVRELTAILGEGKRLVENWHRTLFAVERCPKIVIAAVHGMALAGSLELVMACDLAIATEDARLGDQHMNYNLVPGGSATQRLPRLIGIRKAKELLFSGDWVTGKEAERLNLVNKAVPPDRFDEEVAAFAAKFASKDPDAARLIKELVNCGGQADLFTGITMEKLAVTSGPVGGAAEGLAAFAEKRKPGS
ncbi:MAG: enoyl-CoA hydratase/isomerase family protein [Chloroflexi bacterium]|nr:enoyl-CoA hydratase/isomerase family protein [Chloroflexota bacterium]